MSGPLVAVTKPPPLVFARTEDDDMWHIVPWGEGLLGKPICCLHADSWGAPWHVTQVVLHEDALLCWRCEWYWRGRNDDGAD